MHQYPMGPQLQNHLDSCTDSMHSFDMDYRDHRGSSPVESSRFGSSGNLSQTSSQISETGQESAPGSGLEESLHSYHSTGFHPSINVQQPTNGHIPSNVLGKKLGRPCLDVGKSLNGSLKKLDHSVEKRSNKHLQRIHWLKAINKVRDQLQEGQDDEPNSRQAWIKPGYMMTPK
ncbi:unnamed protein product [Oncorhynchus mykiss]|uniref:Uncharacterized protein n=1 Tax=Oncorhynchus mykiss TaxID=8022 RepID=A0A060VW30_ONCMY|nr:unnamed protein product [Oncorhynchus mykiss]